MQHLTENLQNFITDRQGVVLLRVLSRTDADLLPYLRHHLMLSLPELACHGHDSGHRHHPRLHLQKSRRCHLCLYLYSSENHRCHRRYRICKKPSDIA